MDFEGSVVSDYRENTDLAKLSYYKEYGTQPVRWFFIRRQDLHCQKFPGGLSDRQLPRKHFPHCRGSIVNSLTW